MLWQQGLAADFVHPSHDISRYRAVLVPSLYLISDEAAANLAAYVEGGGTLIVSYFSGVADPDTRVRLGGYPGALRDLLGDPRRGVPPADRPRRRCPTGRRRLLERGRPADGRHSDRDVRRRPARRSPGTR